jgi:hypothetical protein
MIDQICMTYYVFTVIVIFMTLIYNEAGGHKDWVFVACGLVTVTAALVAAVQLINYIWT